MDRAADLGRSPLHPRLGARTLFLFAGLLAACDQRAESQQRVRQEPIAFTSRGDTLRGVLDLPPGPGPHPAIVTGHGSGHVTRDDHYPSQIAAHFPGRGFAVLRFDKRGVGESQGRYPGSTGGAMLIYGADLLAAVDYLAGRPDIDASRIGLFGISQAGWTIPVATVASLGRVAFTIIVSGPTISIAEENAYSDLTGDTHGRASGLSPEEVSRRLALVEPAGFDHYALIEEMAVPGLWIYGELDQSIPWRESVADLARIKARWSRDFTWKTFPGANHGLKVARTGGSWERPVPRQTVPGYLETIEAWLAEKVGLPAGTSGNGNGHDQAGPTLNLRPGRAIAADGSLGPLFAFTGLTADAFLVPEVLLDVGYQRSDAWDADDVWLHASYSPRCSS